MLLGLIFLVLFLDLLFAERGRWLIPWVAIVGLLVVLVVGGWTWGIRATFADLLRVDEYTSFFRVLFAVVALGVVFVSMPYVPRFLPHQGEYYALVLAGTLGMIFMAMADELLTAYISLELLSFSSYILVSYAKRDLKSNEAGHQVPDYRGRCHQPCCCTGSACSTARPARRSSRVSPKLFRRPAPSTAPVCSWRWR